MRKVMLAAAGAGLLGAPAGAETPVPTARATTGWQVEAGADRCLALRQYQVGDRPVILAFQPEPGANRGQFTFRSEDKAHRVNYGALGIKLFVGERLLTTFGAVGAAKDDGALITTAYSLDPKEPPILAGQRSLSLRSPLLLGSFNLGPIDALNRVLDDCNASLLAAWGFSRADQQRLAAMPTWDPSLYFKPRDFPTNALLNMRGGLTSLRFRVDEQGRASDCVVRRSSGTASLDAKSCEIITQRARFTPARDKEGRPMAAVMTYRVAWRIQVMIRFLPFG